MTVASNAERVLIWPLIEPAIRSTRQQRPPELVWSQPRCIGDVPSKRSGHSLTIVKSGVAYLFGGNPDLVVCVRRSVPNAFFSFSLTSTPRANTGCDARRPPGPSNELYKLDMSNREYIQLSSL